MEELLKSTYSIFLNLKEEELKTLKKLQTASSFFTIKSKETKNIIDRLYKKKLITAFTFSINPRILQEINKNLKRYVIFIDCRKASVYARIKKYLYANGQKISSFCTTGDADFVIILTTYESDFQKFITELLSMLEFEAPLEKEEKFEDLINSYELGETEVICGRKISEHKNDLPKLDLDFLTKLHLVLNDYRSNNVKSFFDDEKEVKKFLNLLQRKNILINYRIIRDFLPFKIRVYILLLYSEPGDVHKIIKKTELLAPVVELSSVRPIDVRDEFYRRADYLISAEFENLNSYHQWKEGIYEITNFRINLFSFNVEAIISEIPENIGNYIGFFELCSKYSQGITIGHPIYLKPDPWDEKICLNFDECMGQHGLICGGKDTGKTSTMALLAVNFLKMKKSVFIMDRTEGAKNALNRMGKEFYDKFVREIYAYELDKVVFDRLAPKIQLLRPKDNKELQDLAAFLLGKIKDIKKEKERTVEYVYFFEEADAFFTLSDGEIAKSLFHEIQYAGRECFSIWLSVHAPSYLSLNGKNLANDLKNRIFHRLDTPQDAQIAAELLTTSKSKETTLYPDIVSDLTQLSKGEALLSFWSRTNNRNLAPLKIKTHRIKE